MTRTRRQIEIRIERIKREIVGFVARFRLWREDRLPLPTGLSLVAVARSRG